MSGLVKNQIAKQLARFTKNLSPNKISVKFLKGEGELHNLELDEKILSDLLELPPWLRITKADCNKISAKIHWTKLKTDPICLFLDCVQIDIEQVVVAESKHSPNQSSTQQPPQPNKEKATNQYGFVEKVVDGMYVQINSVLVSFKAPEFSANFQMSRLIVQSTTPDWKPDDLRNTRLKDETKGEVLTFKEITWSTLRIDAFAREQDNSNTNSAPIRLITSQSSLHITIKKRIEDCSVLSACLKLLLDDILWVLTQTQLQALMKFMNSVNKTIEENRRTQIEPASSTTPTSQASQQHTHAQYSSSNLQNGPDKKESTTPFSKHDLLETSYHLRTGRIDLHLSDDSSEVTPSDPLSGGAMQIRINKLATDYYPYHLAGTSRTSWECHNEASLSRAYWVNQLLNTFRNNIRNRKDSMPPRPPKPSTNGQASVDGQLKPPSSPSPRRQTGPPSPKPSRQPPPSSPQRIAPTPGHRRPVFMYETCMLIRCDEFAVMPVTTYNQHNEGNPFLSSDKKALYLPTDMPAFQIDYTQYYYPGEITSPVPPPNLFVQMNPVQLTLDVTTCIWFNRFMTTILGGGETPDCMKQQPTTQPRHVDIRFEALMPRIILPCPSDPCSLYRELRPQALQIQMSQVFFTNSRIGANSSQTELLMILQKFSASKLYSDYGSFPNDMDDVRPLPNLAWLKDSGVVDDPVKIARLLKGMQTDSHHADHCRSSQVWCMSADQVWADFLGIASYKDRPMPFIDAMPVRLWICTPLPGSPTGDVTSRTNGPIPAQQANRQPLNASGTKQMSVATRTSSFPLAHELDPGKRRQLSEPHSAASSPGCKRAHDPLTTPHFIWSNSSPNLKRELAQRKGTSVDIDPLGAVVNGESHSLPSSPRSHPEDVGLTRLGSSESVPSVKSDPADSISLSSQASSSQEDYIFIQNSDNTIDSREELSLCANKPEQDFANQNGQLCEALTPVDDSPLTPTQGGFIGGVLIEDAGVLPPNDQPRYFTDQTPGDPMGPSIYDEESLSDDPSEAVKMADMSVLAYIPTNVVIQLEHFHLIFLFRLQEMLEKLKEQLLYECQKNSSPTDTNDAPETSLTFSLLTKSARLNLILPPCPDSGINGPSRADSSLSSYLDPGFVSDGGSITPEINQDLENNTMSPDGVVIPGKLESAAVKVSPEDGQEVVGEDAGPEASGGRTSRGRRDSDVSSASSQLGTSVESSAKSSARSARSGRIVSIFSAEGGDIQLGIHLDGEDMAVKLIAQELKIDERGNANIEKFLNQKSTKSPARENSIPTHHSLLGHPVLALRAEFGPAAERFAQSAGERGFAHVQAGNINTSFLMSNLESLSDCFDDEVLTPKMPLYVELKNSCVSLRDDKPPRLLSALPPLPINVNIENLTIFRNHEGIVNLRGLSTSSADIRESSGPVTGFRGNSPKPSSRQLSRTASESSIAESVSSRSDVDSERESVKAQLSVSRAALHAVQEERQALLKTIERLQMELTLSNRETDRLHTRLQAYESGRGGPRNKSLR
ncbi:UHRF1-binding protein 1-like [Nematostella vectensis]|uniref:UHRF1-binding protein 1-like n=1 Tax=Nematostella vectensis TaxID=45351 RepID=UPI0020771A92|nr:UHRF1-binding protein 1-like [Nematostella vectensis]